MSDQGFDFRPPSERREARRFEPPPWERDQFEQRAREQAEREAAAEVARAEVLAQQEAARAAEQAAEPPEPKSGAIAGESVEGEALQQGAELRTSAEAHTAELDEKQVALMMLDLRAEEPPALEGAWVVSMAAGLIVALIGFASAIWGGVALSKRGLPVAGTLGGFILLAFGLGFLGLGGWLVFQALRQQGVL
ncbi:MAG: hypothetical protein P4L93_11520 [Coriobacteriia bacterium]|nr:hypothetical protein [Coriobacteriia bacterium]